MKKHRGRFWQRAWALQRHAGTVLVAEHRHGMHVRSEIQSVSIYDFQEPIPALQLQVPQTLQHETALQGLAKTSRRLAITGTPKSCDGWRKMRLAA